MAGAAWNYCRLNMFCVHHATMHQVTSLHAKSYIHRVYACLTVTCQLHFWQNDRDLLCATAQDGRDTKIRVSIESWPGRRKFSRLFCRDSNPWPRVRRSNQWSIPAAGATMQTALADNGTLETHRNLKQELCLHHYNNGYVVGSELTLASVCDAGASLVQTALSCSYS